MDRAFCIKENENFLRNLDINGPSIRSTRRIVYLLWVIHLPTMSVIDELPFGPGYYHGPLRLNANTGFFSWNGSKVIPSAHKIHSGGYYFFF